MGEKDKNLIENHIIIWFINNHGSFGFTSSGYYGNKTPAFQLKVNSGDKKILEEIKSHLGLKNKIYEYHYPGKEKSKRMPQAVLIVRDFNQLKDIIIPFFHNKLTGGKRSQFVEWLERVGKDPNISERFKSLYRLYKSGMYDKLPKFT